LTTISGIDDVVKLLDFGIAKFVALPDDHRLTETGLVLGTPAYMAPEYTRGETATPAGDIYAVGCVMYEALVGELPFTGVNYHAMLHAIQQASPRPLRVVRPDIRLSLADIIDRAMAKDPAVRFPSARSMAEALTPWTSLPPGARSILPLAVAPTVELDLSEAETRRTLEGLDPIRGTKLRD
jgi:serine/threonine protein kinase